MPAVMKEERFRQLFAAFGTLTDCSLKFTKDGKFRKFGFIGFKSEEEAQAALSHFNKSFIDTSRITVEFCKSFGDPTKPRAWSRHAQRPRQPEQPAPGPVPPEIKEDDKQRKVPSELEQLKEDSEFREFLSVHQKRTQVATWANDALDTEPPAGKSKPTSDYLNFDSDSGQESEEEAAEEPAEQGLAPEAAAQKGLSDMEYLKSKVVAATSSSEEESEDEAVNCDDGSEAEESSATETQQARGSTGALPGSRRPPEPRAQTEKPANEKEPTTPHTVKLRGAPFSVTEKNVVEFLAPLKPVAIRIVRNTHGNKTGYVFVDFSSEEEVKKALKCDRAYMELLPGPSPFPAGASGSRQPGLGLQPGGRYIEVFREKHVPTAKGPLQSSTQPWQGRTLGENEEEEDLADSGRLFVRNLPYTSTEEDLERLFSPYGPLSELHYPIDSLTKKPKGFAFVTFMFPEHAVKAYAAVDGQVFQGRMLHVLPSTIRKEASEDADSPGSSYKKKKASKDKASSSSSHNWNTLFMGPNAVADAIAQKYSATKSQVFDHETKGSVAVRVALGETQLVQEVRRFLLDNGVSLDSFSQAAAERSKTVILAKNLPAGTLAAELRETFGRFGSLGRVLLPEGGVTAIVEFLEPLEARRAFRHLAYSKFHHVPLYLEWAPVGVFSSTAPQRKEPQEAPAKSAEKNVVEPEMGLAVCKGIWDPLAWKPRLSLRSADGAHPTCWVDGKWRGPPSSSSVPPSLALWWGPFHLLALLVLSPRGVALQLPAAWLSIPLLHVSVDDGSRPLADGETPGGEKPAGEEAEAPTAKAEEEEEEEEEEDESLPGCTLFIKNLNFSTTEETLREVFSKVGAVKSCSVSKKKSKAGALLSMGFGFVEYRKPEGAQKALKQLQGHDVDGHKLEVRISERATRPALTTARKKQLPRKQTTSKILVRNIPFQADRREIRELFSAPEMWLPEDRGHGSLHQATRGLEGSEVDIRVGGLDVPATCLPAGRGQAVSLSPSCGEKRLGSAVGSARPSPGRVLVRTLSTFGELKTVRLPKKMAGTGTHRGFGFVDFLTKQDAKMHQAIGESRQETGRPRCAGEPAVLTASGDSLPGATGSGNLASPRAGPGAGGAALVLLGPLVTCEAGASPFAVEEVTTEVPCQRASWGVTAGSWQHGSLSPPREVPESCTLGAVLYQDCVCPIRVHGLRCPVQTCSRLPLRLCGLRGRAGRDLRTRSQVALTAHPGWRRRGLRCVWTEHSAFPAGVERAFNALCHSTHLYGRRLVLEWADSEVTLQALRRKTAQHFHGTKWMNRGQTRDPSEKKETQI
ncbi:putative RNA-binding protein 19 [Sciurus carolinensis]|uniref:RNA-binding protein 19 n=1 Tax=Sciurus carolinensis TaxID=30640 RepID=A0AA41NA11_SCICA|nr:putative RNA-binding protein 19 [Sciurus carolinensis]